MDIQNMTNAEWDKFLRIATSDSFSKEDIKELLTCDKYKVIPLNVYTDFSPYSMSANVSYFSVEYISCKKDERYDGELSEKVRFAYDMAVNSYYPLVLTDAETHEILGFLPLAGQSIHDKENYYIDEEEIETKDLTQYDVDLNENDIVVSDIVYRSESPYFKIVTAQEVIADGIRRAEKYVNTYDVTCDFTNQQGELLGSEKFFEKVKESAYATLDTAKDSIGHAIFPYNIFNSGNTSNVYEVEKENGNLKLTRATIVESNDGYVMNAGNTDGSSIITAEDVAEIQCKFNVIGNEVKQAAPKETTNDASLVGGNVQLEEVEEQGTREKQKGEDYGR